MRSRVWNRPRRKRGKHEGPCVQGRRVGMADDPDWRARRSGCPKGRMGLRLHPQHRKSRKAWARRSDIIRSVLGSTIPGQQDPRGN